MNVFILFHETNCGRGDESDGYVEAVYAKREDAERDRITQLQKLIDDGRAVRTDPENPAIQWVKYWQGARGWTDDLTVIEFQVITGDATEPGEPAPAGWQKIEAGAEAPKSFRDAIEQARASARVAELDLRLALRACALRACDGRGAAFMVLSGILEAGAKQHAMLSQLLGLLEDGKEVAP